MRTRRALVIVVVVLGVATGCQKWSQFMGNPALNGVQTAGSPISTATVAGLQQTFNIWYPGGLGRLSPTIENGYLYSANRDGFYAADATGQQNCDPSSPSCFPLWKADFPSPSSYIWVPSQPLVSDGIVYVTIDAGGIGHLYAYDADGVTNCSGSLPARCTPLWQADVDSRGGVNVSGGVLYVADVFTQKLEAFDAKGTTGCGGTPRTCSPLWTASVQTSSTPSIANGLAYVATAEGSPAVLAYDASGSRNCSGVPKVCTPLFSTTLPGNSVGSVNVMGETGYVETLSPSRLVAFDARFSSCPVAGTSCTPSWTAPLDDPAASTPAVAHGKVYAASQYSVAAFDAAGVDGCDTTTHTCAPLWHITPRGANEDASPMVVNDLVFVGPHAYDANGVVGCRDGSPGVTGTVCDPLWETQMYTIRQPTVTVVDGRLFTSSLVAYELP